ncbi:hypothetical protein ACLD72_012475 [Paenibacillus sp. TH7-28]
MAFLLLIGNEGLISVFAEGDNDPTLRVAAGAKPYLLSEELIGPGLLQPPGQDLEAVESPALPEGQSVTDSVYRALLAVEKTELVIHPGESVRFTNDSGGYIAITADAKPSNGICYDYVSYNSNGKVVSEDMCSTGTVGMQDGYTSVITVDYDQPLTVKFKPELTYSYSSTPALLKKSLVRGENYIFSNQGDAARSIMSDASTSKEKSYDYAIYKDDGSLVSSGLDSVSKPILGVGNEIVLTGASNNPVTVAVPYEGYSGYESDEPAYDSVLLNSGESYKFTNVGTKSDRIEHSGSTKDKFDYVVYNEEGTETSRGTNTTTLPQVAVGRYAVVTLLTENPVRVGAPYRTFMSGGREDDAITRITLSPGVSYKFTNNGTLRNPIKNNARKVDGLYDYTVFEADGSYSSEGFDSISTPWLPAGGFAIITVQGTAAVTFDYTDDFSADPSDESSHFRMTLSQGESYEFKNITSSARYLRSNATKDNRFDWVEYYPDGTQQGKRENTYTNPQVSGGNSIVVTTVSAPVTFGANYRLFSWKDKPGEAISKQVIHLGESYKFSNTGSKLITINSDAGEVGGKYDVAVYSGDGSVHSVTFEETGNVSIPAGGYAILTGESAIPVTISYTDTFTVVPAEHPALLRATVAPGDSYTYVNISDETENLYSNDTATNEFAYVIRRPDGTVSSDGPGRHTYVPVQAGYSVTVTPLTSSITFGGVYTSFTGKPDENQMVKQVIRLGESYKFSNTGSKLITINSDAGEVGGKYDVAVYSDDGSVHSSTFEEKGNVSIPAGGYAILTGQSVNSVTISYMDPVTVTPADHPALLRATVAPGASYTYVNTSNELERLYSNATTANRFAYVIRRPDGTVSSDAPSHYTYVSVSAGYSVTITPLTSSITFGGVYTSFTGKPDENQTGKQVIRLGESYKVSNTGSKQIKLNSDVSEVQGKYDVVVYSEDGKVYNSVFEETKNVTIPAGGYAILTGQSTNPMTVSYTDPVTVAPADHPALLRATVNPGSSYTYKNVSKQTGYLYSNASATNKFAYVVRTPDGTVSSDAPSNQFSVAVREGYSVTVTPLTASLTFGAVYTSFTGMPSENPIAKQVIRLGESYKVSNTGSEQIKLNSDVSEVQGKYDVVVYSKDGKVYNSVFEETKNVTIPAGGYAILTGQSTNPMTVSYTDPVTVAPADHPALLRATVNPGSSYTYKNVSKQTGYLYSNASATNKFAYVVRTPDGTVSSDAPSNQFSVAVREGYSVTVTPLTSSITFGAVYTLFTGMPGENPAVGQVTLTNNESYLFTNLESSAQTLMTDAKAAIPALYDYAIYGTDGKPEKAEFDQDGNLSVPAGNQVVVTVTTANPVTFTYGQAFEASPSAEPALLKKTLETNQSIGFKNKSAFEAKLTTNASTSSGHYFDYTIFDSSGAVVRQGEQTVTSYGVPSGGKIQVKTTSANPVVYAAPYRIFEFAEAQEHIFEELQHRQLLDVKKAAGENGYYRFVAPEAGRYRFVTKEMNNFAQQPVLTLYDRPDLLEPIGSSEQAAQEFGIDYTVLETDLTSGQIVYLKLSEKNGLPLELQLIVSIMTIVPETKLQYSLDGKLLQMTFPTGDKLIYEYDSKGNLMQRVKKVYPF